MAIDLAPVDLGFLLGVLIGEGTFGGDGRQAHITLRMHIRHERLFHHLTRLVPGSRLYGPYHHGQRSYFQWMVRGNALRELVPLLAAELPALDDYATERFRLMCERYRIATA